MRAGATRESRIKCPPPAPKFYLLCAMRDAKPLRLFVGIFCRPNQYDHRSLMRSTMLEPYLPNGEPFSPSPLGTVVHRFVVCGSGKGTSGAIENEKRDVIVLPVLNKGFGGMCGKHRGSIEFFQQVDELFGASNFDWILKTDYDAYVVLPNLMRILKPLPTTDGYFGIHCVTGHKASGVQLYREYKVDDIETHSHLFFDDMSQPTPYWFMCGMLYGVTGDVASWLRKGAKPPKRKIGMTGEDFLLRAWLHEGKRGKQAYTCGWAHCYDLPHPSTASQNALPSDATARMHPSNRTTIAIEKALHARHREMNKEGVMANGLEDERHGHYGVGPRLDAWRAYGHSMLSETVVVHNIKTFAEYLQVAATFQRYKASIAGASGSAESWTRPLQTDSATGIARFRRTLGLPP